MADTDRMSVLPMIKCSTCGVDIEILQLADHVCAPQAKNDAPKVTKLDRAATFGGESKNQTRPGRMPAPPRIDPYAANKPYRPQNQLSPVGNHDPAVHSPLSPARGRLPFQMNRSVTSPIPRSNGPPSPDLPTNLDCAFPPFPTANASRARSKSRARDRLEPLQQTRSAEGNSMYAPLSPRINAGQNIAKRMDTIAPGPFDGRGGDSRPSTSDGRRPSASQRGHQRTATLGSITSNPSAANQRASVASTRSRSSSFSSRGFGLPTNPREAPAVPPLPPNIPQSPEPAAEGIDAFLSRLKSESMLPRGPSADSQSKADPVNQERQEKPEPRPEQGRPSVPYAPTRRPGEPKHSKPLSPPKNDPRSRSPVNGTLPSSTAPMQPNGLPLNPLHTPSVSEHSAGSISSSGFRSLESSQSSPATSMDSTVHSRDNSKAPNADFIPGESIPRAESPESFMDPRTPPRPGKSKAPLGFDRGKAPGPILQPPSVPFVDTPPESPLDPAIQQGTLAARKPPEAKHWNRIDSPIDLHLDPAPPVAQPELRPPPEARPTATSKGDCRGCSQPIFGKSVKDGSGRLTGRYHKECFVCRTCQKPFPSAEFYVFDNSPYCEHHYHLLNGSLCRACNRGIEGQYLETDQRFKFHPRCFTCLTCRVVLRDDYYEVGGKAYCERHAYAAQKSMRALAPGHNRFAPNNNLQKRRTRLMMMM